MQTSPPKRTPPTSPPPPQQFVGAAFTTAVILCVLVVVTNVNGTHSVNVFVLTGAVVVIVLPALTFDVAVAVTLTVVRILDVTVTVVKGAVTIDVKVEVPTAPSWIVMVGASGPRLCSAPRLSLVKPVGCADRPAGGSGRPVSRGRSSARRPRRPPVARSPGIVTEIRRLTRSATRAVGAAVVGQARVLVEVATMLVAVLVCVKVMSARVVRVNGGNNGVIVLVAAYAPETVVVMVLAVDVIVSV